MTANDSTPEEGQDGTDIGRESFPLREASDDETALALEEQKQEAREAVNDVCAALLNDDVELEAEDVARLGDAGLALSALSRTLSLRVPAHEFEELDGDD
jgi:hypothetical protein